MRNTWLKRTLILLAVLGTGIGYGGWYLNQPVGSRLDIETEPVSRGELKQIVTASGQLNPVVKVDVGSQISGIIQRLFVDFNSTVKEGQVIAQIDPATYQANLLQAEGNLTNAQAVAELARLNADRAKTLQAEKLNPKAEYDQAMASLHQAQGDLRISEGALKKAQVDLARCTIYAPIDGLVISRNVNVGQTVAASLSAPTLFIIANDLTKMQIETDVAEADIGLVQMNQDVEFTVDAFPGQKFAGKVAQVRYAPKIEAGVVTYVTIIEVNNPEMKLKPGMTANVSIVVARSNDALRIPNSALRVRISGVESSKSDDSKSSEKSDKSQKKGKRKSERTVYVASKKEPGPSGEGAGQSTQSVAIRTGITDGRYTEVIDGLKEGDHVVVDVSKESDARGRSFNPFAAFSR